MKKFLALALAVLMLLSLAACGEKTPVTNDENTTPSSQQTEDPGQQEQTQLDNEDEGQSEDPDQSASKNDENNPASMLPENFFMVAPGLDLYKIGNDFMDGSSDFWRYIGEGLYEIYYWDNDRFVDSGCTCGMESFLEFTADYLKDCTKTDETKEICGVTCVKYTDILGTEYYLNEESNLIFEIWYKDATRAAYAVTTWDTTVTEFPVAAPQK